MTDLHTELAELEARVAEVKKRIAEEPKECWVNFYDGYYVAHASEERAQEGRNTSTLRVAVHMREVKPGPVRVEVTEKQLAESEEMFCAKDALAILGIDLVVKP